MISTFCPLDGSRSFTFTSMQKSAAAEGLGAVTSIDLHVVHMSYYKPTTYTAETYNQSYNRKIEWVLNIRLWLFCFPFILISYIFLHNIVWESSCFCLFCKAIKWQQNTPNATQVFINFHFSLIFYLFIYFLLFFMQLAPVSLGLEDNEHFSINRLISSLTESCQLYWLYKHFSAGKYVQDVWGP